MNKTIYIVNRILGKIYFLFAICIVLMAILVTIARSLTPVLSHYKSNLAHIAESYLGRPVNIEEIQVGLRGFQPVLDLKSVIVFSKNKRQQVFKIQDLQVGLDLIDSIKKRKVIVSRLFLNGMHIILQQNKQLQWNVKGFSLKNTNTKTGVFEFKDVLSWLLNQPQIVLEDINLKIDPYNRSVHQIRDLDLALNNTDVLHQLRGTADLSGNHSPIDLIIDLKGNANDVDNLDGHFYLKGVKTPFAQWLGTNVLYGYSCQQGNFSFQVWGDWQKDKVNNIQTKIDFSNLAFINKAKKETLTVPSLQGNLYYTHPTAQSWTVNGDKLKININGHVWHENKFAFTLDKQSNDSAQYRGFFSFLQLDDISNILANLAVVPKNIQALAKNLNAQGELHNFAFNVEQKDKVLGYHVNTSFFSLSNDPYKNIPGVSNLDGKLNMSNNAGILSLSSANANINDQALFSRNFAFKQFQVYSQWQSHNGNLSLQIYNLKAADTNLNLAASADLYLANKKEQSTLSVLGHYQLNDLATVKNYLPTKVLPTHLQEWLKQAFVAGSGATGEILIKGPLQKIPYPKYKGQFVIDSMLKDLELQFAPDWPHLMNLDGHLIFHQRRMSFAVQNGELMQQPIENLTAVIPNLNRHPHPILTIDSNVNFSQIAQARKFIFQSPLKGTLGKTIDPLYFTGMGKLFLKLNISLGTGDTKVEGALDTKNVLLSIPSLRLKFPNLNGAIHFTNHTLSAKSLTATLFDEPFTASISTLNFNNKHITQIIGDTTLKMTDIKDYLYLQSLNFITGISKFKSILDIDQAGNSHLVLTSDLKGVKVDMPQPFFKSSQQIKSLQVDAYLKDDTPPLIRLTYSKLAGGILGFAKKGKQSVFQRAKIHLGLGAYILQKAPGVFIGGNLSNFDLNIWLDFFKRYINSNHLNKSDSMGEGRDLVKQIDVNIGLLKALKQNVKNIHLQFNRELKNWVLSLSSQQVNGTMQIPFDYHKNTIEGQFTNLHLHSLTDNKKIGVKQLDPKDILPLDISALSFIYAGKEYGQVTLKTKPIKNGVKLDQLSIVNKQYILNTHGRWTRENKKDASSFSGNVYTDDLGTLLKTEGFSEHIHEGSGSADFSLSWPGAPSGFQTADLQGAIKLNFEDGAIVGLNEQTNKKIGIGKLVNILSVQSILKRLTLNFSDLNESGYSFSKLTGELSIYNGNVYTQNLYLNGSVAEIYLQGMVGMLQKTYDIDLKINPYVTSSLPLIATIAGGPVTGVATWLVSKLARPGIEKIVSYKYHIGGTWSDPKVVEIKAKEKETKEKEQEPKNNESTT